jgi:hypothetical protein
VGSYAFVTANFVEPDYGEIQAVDISDPANPTYVTATNIPGGAYGIYVSGDYAYIAAFTYGLRIFDISSPNSPTTAGFFDTPGSAKRTFVSGNLAFVADGTSGLEMFDISDPYSPVLIDSVNTPGNATDVAVDNGFVYIADDNSLEIYQITETTCNYITGDINANGAANGIDVTYGVAFFKGGNAPPLSCSCPPYGVIFPAGDVNGNCQFNGIDITYFVTYLKGGQALQSCPSCPASR